MRVLVHICCGPCGITVLQGLRAAGHELCGFFFNPNIHPLSEYMRRRQGAAQVAEQLGLPMLFADCLPLADQIWNDPWLAGAGLGSSHPQVVEGEPDPQCVRIAPAADPAPWLRAVAGREEERCAFCWRVRLRKSAAIALARGFEAVSTSLLFSRYQNHEAIHAAGRAAAAEQGIAFLYEDFRSTWREGVSLSREWGVYRQQYCGCLHSEYDRYNRDFTRLIG